MRFVLTAVLALCVALPAAARKTEPAPLRIMPMGDSITEGGDGFGGYRKPLFDMITGAQGRQPNFVGGRNLLGVDPLDCVDSDQDGYSGYRIDQIDNGGAFFNALPLEERLRTWDPAVVLLHAGTNDAQQQYYFDADPQAGVPSAIDRLDELVTRIVRFNPEIYIIVAQIIPANPPATQATSDYIVKLNALIPAMVARHQAAGDRVSLVDQYTPMLNVPNPDGIHPGPEGYAVMADTWFAGIQALGVVPKNGNPGRFSGVSQFDRWSRESSTPWTLTPNLISQGAATLAGSEVTDYYGKRDPALLNDGSLKDFTDDRNTLFTATYSLNTSSAPKGYDIDEIRSDAGLPLAENGDQRAGQAYELWYSTVDAPDTFRRRGVFHHISVSKAERASQMDISGIDGASLMKHVAKLQFRFVLPPVQLYGFIGLGHPTLYRELEVFGKPTGQD